MNNYRFEVCANSVESCVEAQKGGADRIELCAGIPEGGTTPSYGEITTARDLLTTTRLHVIIRPRGGDFLYSAMERRAMMRDIEMARRCGADGVVIGCLTPKGDIDLPLVRQLKQVAEGLSVTFHRAFDVCRNPLEALEQLIDLGCHRILTSGAKATAEEGIPLLKLLHEQAAGRIIILAGCGVNEGNIAHIASETGIHEFHFSARHTLVSGMNYRNESVSMGGMVHINEYERSVTSAERVRATIAQLIK